MHTSIGTLWCERATSLPCVTAPPSVTSSLASAAWMSFPPFSRTKAPHTLKPSFEKGMPLASANTRPLSGPSMTGEDFDVFFLAALAAFT